MRALIVVTLVSLWCSVAVGLLGASLLWILRRTSLIILMLVLTITTVLEQAAVVAGLALTGVLTASETQILLLALVPVGAVSVAVCALLAGRLLLGSRELALATRNLGREGLSPFPAPSTGAELAGLYRELAATGVALEASRRQERLLEASRRQLIAWLSHDLRTPMANLRAMVEALQDGMVRDQAYYHRQIMAETERLDQMVADLFDLSLMQSNSFTLSLTAVQLYDLISDVVAMVAPLAREQGVRVRQDGIDQVRIDVDVRQITRVLTNLLHNAVRHTPRDAAVTISARSAGERVIIQVTDACGGIPEDDLPKVFDAGWRGRQAAAASAGGGLGLAIVRGIAAAHGGEVGVRNVHDGCQFTVTIPRAVMGGPNR